MELTITKSYFKHFIAISAVVVVTVAGGMSIYYMDINYFFRYVVETFTVINLDLCDFQICGYISYVISSLVSFLAIMLAILIASLVLDLITLPVRIFIRRRKNRVQAIKNPWN